MAGHDPSRLVRPIALSARHDHMRAEQLRTLVSACLSGVIAAATGAAVLTIGLAGIPGSASTPKIDERCGPSVATCGSTVASSHAARTVLTRDIERWLLLVNDLPGVSTEAVLTPDPGVLGAATLVVTVEHKAVDGYATLDNHGSVFAGPVNAALNARLNGIGGFGGQIEALGFSTFDREQNFGELSFAGRVGDSGARLRGYAAYGPSVPGSSLRPLDIFSRSILFGIGGDYPLIRSRLLNVTLNGAVEMTNDRVDVLGEPLTLHVEGLIRASPGWNLWVSGPPNAAKDGIAPLSGVIETDWSPYSFTMDWRFTRPDHWVRCYEDEAFCFFFPVPRGVTGAVRPRFRPLADAPDLADAFRRWSASRDAFHAQVRDTPPTAPADKWEKLYYRGVRPDGSAGPADHQAKMRACPFTAATGRGRSQPQTP